MIINTEIYFIFMSVCFLVFPAAFILFLEFLISGYRNVNVVRTIKSIYINKYAFLIFLSLCLPLIWQFIPLHILRTREVNFAQHALGGGFAVALGCIYIILYYFDKYTLFKNTLFQALFIYFTVSAFGSLNEMLEFALDFLGVGIFSADRYDTWYDIVANTSGALAAFTIFLMCQIIYKVYKFVNKSTALS
jgi:hypothetical protein